MMAQNLKSIRSDIAGTKAEIREVQNAQPPLNDQIQRVRDHLQGLADEAQRRIVEASANVISHDNNPTEITPSPAVSPYMAIGLGIAAIGVDALVKKAVAVAQEQESGALRLPASERRAKLLELARKLYALELDEERALGAEDRRPDCNGAAVLGIPFDVALEAGLIGGIA